MKRMSIKLKITLYFTAILSLLSFVLLLYIASIAKNIAKNELFDEAIKSVNTLYADIHYERIGDEPQFPPSSQPRPDPNKKPFDNDDKPANNILEIPEGTVYTDGNVKLYILQTSDDNSEISHYGELPSGVSFDPSTAKIDGKIVLNGDDGKYYVYYKFLRNPAIRNGGAWVVGAISAHLTASVVFGTTKLTMLSLPIIILLAALLGYAITKHAFRPVADITATAAEIAGSNDLSRRINLGDGNDEISKLAQTFDGMLDTIQHNYEKEKQFTDDASHELRTPVAVIMAQSELALEPKATESDLRDAARIIYSQSIKMKKLLAELLSLARADNHKTVLEKEHFDLRELAEIIVEEQQILADERNIKISLAPGESVDVFADRTAIMRVLFNFISNAIKYGKDGGIIEVSVEKTDTNGACCKVRDNGIGIDEEHLPKIWDRFFRVVPSRTVDKYHSVGLGLSLAKSIIDAHEGSVGVESVLGKGSVFSFTI